MFTKIVYSGFIVYNTVVIIHKILNNYSLYRNNKEKGYIYILFEICTLFIFLHCKQIARNAGEAVPIWLAAWLSVSPPVFGGGSGRAGCPGWPALRRTGSHGVFPVPFRRRCAQFAHAYKRCVRVFAPAVYYYI